MKEDSDRIAVIVVNYNGGEMLLQCLGSVRAQSLHPSRVIVVDNASSDGSADTAMKLYPDYEFVRMERNLGFAAANNYAANLADDCKWLALLNPDAFAVSDWLEKTIDAGRKNPEFSIFGACMLKYNDPSYLDGMGDVYHPCGLAWRNGYGKIPLDDSMRTREIFSACAAAALYKRDDFLAAGGFDDDYICYFEDVDLGFRLRLFGKRCLLVADAIVYHVGSATTGGRNSDFAVYHGHRNLVWTYVKNMPDVMFWMFLPLHIGINLITIAWFVFKGQGGIILRAKRDALRGIPRMWRKRCKIKKQRVAPSCEIWRVMDKSISIMRPHLHNRVS